MRVKGVAGGSGGGDPPKIDPIYSGGFWRA